MLLTSRRDEFDWLGDLPLRIKIPVMPMQERVQLARAIAEKHGRRLAEIALLTSIRDARRRRFVLGIANQNLQLLPDNRAAVFGAARNDFVKAPDRILPLTDVGTDLCQLKGHPLIVRLNSQHLGQPAMFGLIVILQAGDLVESQ